MKHWIVLILLIGGCVRDIVPINVGATDNPGTSVSKLFTYDDCTVYRFTDGGREHYFVKCPCTSHALNEQTHTAMVGKVVVTTSEPDDILTSYAFKVKP